MFREMIQIAVRITSTADSAFFVQFYPSHQGRAWCRNYWIGNKLKSFSQTRCGRSGVHLAHAAFRSRFASCCGSASGVNMTRRINANSVLVRRKGNISGANKKFYA
jgi:hypothetical protein